jgi:hypothetical protein
VKLVKGGLAPIEELVRRPSSPLDVLFRTYSRCTAARSGIRRRVLGTTGSLKPAWEVSARQVRLAVTYVEKAPGESGSTQVAEDGLMPSSLWWLK